MDRLEQSAWPKAACGSGRLLAGKRDSQWGEALPAGVITGRTAMAPGATTKETDNDA